MEEQLISFETAKLAKKKGFIQNPFVIKRAYAPTYIDGSDIKLNHSLFSPDYNIATAPTQSLLQKWLREKHNLRVIADYFTFGVTSLNGYYYMINRGALHDKSTTYEKALEQGLQKALHKIKIHENNK